MLFTRQAISITRAQFRNYGNNFTISSTARSLKKTIFLLIIKGTTTPVQRSVDPARRRSRHTRGYASGLPSMPAGTTGERGRVDGSAHRMVRRQPVNAGRRKVGGNRPDNITVPSVPAPLRRARRTAGRTS